MCIWKDIEGYKGLYQVSNTGLVKSLITNKILKPSKRRYSSVVLCKDNKKKYPNIHRLVAKAFIDNPNNFPIVMHLDNNGHNNCVTNLKWGTHSDNNKQAYIDGNQEHTKKINSTKLKDMHKIGDKRLKNYA